MFVCYAIRNRGYGYMCFRQGTSITYIKKFLNDVMLDETRIIFARNFSKEPVNFIETYTDGRYRLEKYKGFIRNVDDVCNIVTCLYHKYGFTNILGYH